jgi:hypothetical protein
LNAQSEIMSFAYQPMNGIDFFFFQIKRSGEIWRVVSFALNSCHVKLKLANL